jgi:hypothetical protein
MRCATCGTDNEPDSRFCGNCGAKVNPTFAPDGAFTTKPGPGRVAPTQKITGDSPLTPAARIHPPSMPPPLGQPGAAPVIQIPASNKPPSMPPPAGEAPPRTVSAPPRTYSTPPSQRGPTPRPSANVMPPGSLPSAAEVKNGIRQSDKNLPPAPAVNGSAPARAPARPSEPNLANPSRPQAAAAPPQPQKPLIRESAAEISVPRGGRNWFLIVFLFLVDLGLAGAGIYLLQRGLVRDDEIPTAGSGATP